MGVFGGVWRLRIEWRLSDGYTRLGSCRGNTEGGSEGGRVAGSSGREGVGGGKAGEAGLLVDGKVGWRNVSVHDGLAVVVVGAASALWSLCWLRNVSEGLGPESCVRVVPLALPRFPLSCHRGDLHHRVCHQPSCPVQRTLPGVHLP